MEPEMSQFWGSKVAFRTYVLGLAVQFAAASLGLAQVAIPSCTALGGSFCSQPVGQMSGEQPNRQHLSARDARRISDAIHYLEDRFAERLSLDDLASEAAMSKYLPTW